jgi:putative hydrolase
MTNQSEPERLAGLIFEARSLDLANLPKVDCHIHTSWTDGINTVKEIYHAAQQNELTAILYSEHSRKTSTDWFNKFAAEVRALPTSACCAYVGTEVKVETHAGDIDTTPAISDHCDFIIASVHRFIDSNDNTIGFTDIDPAQAVEIEYALTWSVLQNPQVDILGHMFGMSYKRFGQAPPEKIVRDLIARAAKFGVAVEVNSHYHPNALKMLKWCKELDAKIAFGSDAHTIKDVGAITRQLSKELAVA